LRKGISRKANIEAGTNAETPSRETPQLPEELDGSIPKDENVSLQERS